MTRPTVLATHGADPPVPGMPAETWQQLSAHSAQLPGAGRGRPTRKDHPVAQPSTGGHWPEPWPQLPVMRETPHYSLPVQLWPTGQQNEDMETDSGGMEAPSATTHTGAHPSSGGFIQKRRVSEC